MFGELLHFRGVLILSVRKLPLREVENCAIFCPSQDPRRCRRGERSKRPKIFAHVKKHLGILFARAKDFQAQRGRAGIGAGWRWSPFPPKQPFSSRGAGEGFSFGRRRIFCANENPSRPGAVGACRASEGLQGPEAFPLAAKQVGTVPLKGIQAHLFPSAGSDSWGRGNSILDCEGEGISSCCMRLRQYASGPFWPGIFPSARPRGRHLSSSLGTKYILRTCEEDDDVLR